MIEVKEGYDRVTEVVNYLKDQDYIDYVDRTEKRERNKKIAQAMKIGSEVDSIIKQLVSTGNRRPSLLKGESRLEVEECVEAFLTWNKCYMPKLVVGERLYNDELHITGEIDLIADREIIDVKCSLAVYKSYWLQLGGYAYLFPAKRVSILRLSKGGAGYEYVVEDDIERLKTLFVSSLNLYRFYKKVEVAEQVVENNKTKEIVW